MEMKIKDALLSENGEELEVRGIISNLKEGLTKTGKPFVDADLFANGSLMTLKVWDTGLEEFKREKGVNIGIPVLCHGAININPQNSVKQLVLRDGNEMPAISILDMAEVSSLSQATEKPINKMRSAVTSKEVCDRFLPGISEETYGAFYNISLRVLEEVELASECPYSCEIRHYKGGFIEHLYKVVYKMLYNVGLPVLDTDWSVVYIAVLMYHLGFVKRTVFNQVTGLVEEKDEFGPIELGSDGMCDFAYAMSLIPSEALGDPRVKNLRHCVAVLNRVVDKPATIEAQIAFSFVKDELGAQIVAEATQNIPEGTKGMKVLNGEVRSFIKY